ncbi:MAG: arylesterase [Pseudomonadota bacterium]
MTLASPASLARYVAGFALCKILLVAFLAISANPAHAQPQKLIAIGDSLTHGFGLEQDKGFVPQLERWLRDQGHDVTVINMGVSGDTTEGGRARLGWALADGGDAVIVELGGNDLLRGIDPARSRDNLAAMLTELQAAGLPVLLTGMSAPLNYGPEFKEAFDSMYPELAEEYGAILYPSFLEGVVGTEGPAEGLMQDDGIHPNATGVALIVEGIGPKVLELLERAGK